VTLATYFVAVLPPSSHAQPSGPGAVVEPL
jgi:hypothetical protein